MKHLKTTIALSLGLMMCSTMLAQGIKKFTFDVLYGIEHVETVNKGTNLFVPKNTQQRADNVALNVNYRLTDRFVVKMGLRHTLMTQTVVSNVFVECGNTTPQEIESAKVRLETAQYREIAFPLALRYYICAKENALKQYADAGTEMLISDEGNTRTGLRLGYGFEMPLFKKMAFFIQPTYRFAFGKRLNSARLDAKIQQHNIGIEAGLRF